MCLVSHEHGGTVSVRSPKGAGKTGTSPLRTSVSGGRADINPQPKLVFQDSQNSNDISLLVRTNPFTLSHLVGSRLVSLEYLYSPKPNNTERRPSIYSSSERCTSRANADQTIQIHKLYPQQRWRRQSHSRRLHPVDHVHNLTCRGMRVTYPQAQTQRLKGKIR